MKLSMPKKIRLKNNHLKEEKQKFIIKWELDTVVSTRGKSKACLATFVERKTRFYISLPKVDQSKNSMLEAIKT